MAESTEASAGDSPENGDQESEGDSQILEVSEDTSGATEVAVTESEMETKTEPASETELIIDATDMEPVTEDITESTTEVSVEVQTESDIEAVTEVESDTEIQTETELELLIEESLDEAELLLVAEEIETTESETEVVDEDPVPDKFKLVNTNSFAAVPNKYAVDPSANNAATRIRRVVFYADDGSTVKRDAYCLQPNLDTPGNGTYDKDSNRVEILESSSKEKNLAKCLYYMYGGPAWGKTIDYADGSGSVNMKSKMEGYGCSTKNHFFAVTHYVLGYLYVGASGKWNANTGVYPVMNSDGEAMIKKLASYIKKLPVPQTTLSETSVTTTYNADAGVNVSKTVTYKSIDEDTATITLPDGITLVNETTNTRSTGKVTIEGGTKFHLEALPEITGTGSYTLNCKYAVDFTAFALKTSGKQDIGFSYYSGDKILTLSVEWPNQAEVRIVKKDAVSGKNLAGAVYGIYSDAACTSLIVQMPATDSNGVSSVTINKTQDTVYLKEISVPSGYVLNTSVYDINLIAGDTVTQNVTNKEQLAKLTVYKNGEVLTGANVTDAGVSFSYTEQRQKGAIYNVYAGADIVAADGTVAYKKGSLVKAGLTTEADGSAVLDNLHLGTYLVEEQAAPVNL
ncbi:MAG: hypothetical protein J6M22_03820, partial [Firmicutes bacterium]|nr:hypothetical protein [Bacillota bacterium]